MSALNEFQIKNTNVVQFDSIRFIFALFVIIVHHQFSVVNVPSAFAYLAMHIFFVMSAFLISRGLLISKPKATSFIQFYKDFYIKRILRIFPVYFVYLFCIVLIGFLFYIIGFGDVFKLIPELKKFGWMLLTFTYNYREMVVLFQDIQKPDFILFSHLWSLSLEEQFYVLIPFLIYFLDRKKIVYISIFFILAMPVFRVWYYQNVLNEETDYVLKGLIYYRASFLQFDCFFYGILLATYDFKHNYKLYKFVFYSLLVVYLGSIVFNGIVFSLNSNVSFFTTITRYDFMILNYQYLYHDVMINWLIFFMFLNCFYNPKFLSFFNQPFILNAGNRLTYSSYVYQYIFILPMRAILYPIMQKFISLPEFIIQLFVLFLSVFFIYLLSNLSYKKMEIKFLNLLKNKNHALRKS